MGEALQVEQIIDHTGQILELSIDHAACKVLRLVTGCAATQKLSAAKHRSERVAKLMCEHRQKRLVGCGPPRAARLPQGGGR